ncbi:hypothetical protein V6N13_143552 [Hibiscus sabdariffa]
MSTFAYSLALDTLRSSSRARHTLTSGPASYGFAGLVVQPLVGHVSDRCNSRFGRRRPYIVAGAVSIIVAVLIIGHSVDIGWLFGVLVELFLLTLPKRIIEELEWQLLTSHYLWSLAIFLAMQHDPTVVVTTYVSVLAAKEVSLGSVEISTAFNEEGPEHSCGNAEEAFLRELFGTFRYFSGTIWIILSVTTPNWIGWFPFLLFDTDWMGREIYGGEPTEGSNYAVGVRMGAFGWMLNSVVLGITSVLMEKLCSKRGAGFIWGVSSILMALCFLSMLILSYVANDMGYIGHDLPPVGIVIAAVLIFSVLGFPLAITYSVLYALISTRIESLGLGQGLSMGVRNLAIVIPQGANILNDNAGRGSGFGWKWTMGSTIWGWKITCFFCSWCCVLMAILAIP